MDQLVSQPGDRAAAPTVIRFVAGDATRPDGPRPAIICHVVNDLGAWGRGFVLALEARWPGIRNRYKEWATGLLAAEPEFRLGAVQFVEVEPGLTVANMCAQHSCGPGADGRPPIRYAALRTCLETVAVAARAAPALVVPVHMPRVGCGLAGGTWPEVEAIVRDALCACGVPVTVYDLPA